MIKVLRVYIKINIESVKVFVTIFINVFVGNNLSRSLIQEMQQAEHIDRTQEAESEQAVDPRYLIRRTNPRTQVETGPTISKYFEFIESKAACEELEQRDYTNERGDNMEIIQKRN